MRPRRTFDRASEFTGHQCPIVSRRSAFHSMTIPHRVQTPCSAGSLGSCSKDAAGDLGPTAVGVSGEARLTYTSQIPVSGHCTSRRRSTRSLAQALRTIGRFSVRCRTRIGGYQADSSFPLPQLSASGPPLYLTVMEPTGASTRKDIHARTDEARLPTFGCSTFSAYGNGGGHVSGTETVVLTADG
jgi:hypothetical protein